MPIPTKTAARAVAVLAVVGVVNIPIIKYSVEWWNTLHQPATFKLTEKPTMVPEMWVPLLLAVLGTYLLFGWAALYRMQTEVLRRERRTRWVKELTPPAAVRNSNPEGPENMAFDSFSAFVVMGAWPLCLDLLRRVLPVGGSDSLALHKGPAPGAQPAAEQAMVSSGQADTARRDLAGGSFQRIPTTQNESISKS